MKSFLQGLGVVLLIIMGVSIAIGTGSFFLLVGFVFGAVILGILIVSGIASWIRACFHKKPKTPS